MEGKEEKHAANPFASMTKAPEEEKEEPIQEEETSVEDELPPVSDPDENE